MAKIVTPFGSLVNCLAAQRFMARHGPAMPKIRYKLKNHHRARRYGKLRAG
jgi:hypothetical protein